MSQLALVQAWEIGCFHALVNFSNLYLSAAVWACVLLGAGLQLLLLKKAKRWVLPAVLLAVLVGVECACQLITGWDLLAWLLLYALALLMLVGAGLCALLVLLRNKRERR